MSRKPLQVRMDPAILERVQRLAKSRGLNVQDLIRAFTARQLSIEEKAATDQQRSAG